MLIHDMKYGIHDMKYAVHSYARLELPSTGRNLHNAS